MMKGLRRAGGLSGALLAVLTALVALTVPAPARADGDPGLGDATSAPQPAAAAAPANGAPPSTSGAPAVNSASLAPNAGGGAYTVRLHDFERRVNELKEQIFRSKARLNLLKETVLHGVIAGSHALITHRNDMGSTYKLVRLVYALDGAQVFAKSDDSGTLGDTKEFEIFNGSIVPGNHTLSVMMVYQGNGLGIFSYFKGYKFTVRGSHTFTAVEGKQTQLKVVGFEQGNALTTDPKDRPAIDFRMNVVADKPTVTTPPEAAAAAPAAAAPATTEAGAAAPAPTPTK